MGGVELRLERSLTFCLQAANPQEARRWLQDPTLALSQIKVFRDLELKGGVLSGFMAAPFAIVGEVRFPFRSRFRLEAEAGTLTPIAADEATSSDTSAELGGRARLEGDRVCFQAELLLRLNLPEGEKWGGRAFRKMAEAAFERTLSRTLHDLG